jgi:dephospho-CoA kinase
LTYERPDVVAVGLTGGIGAGKTTALRFFADSGALTLSADEVVHRLYAQDAVRSALCGHFGTGVLDSQGDVDRCRLAEAVRGRPEQLGWLEALVHPMVGEEIARFVQAAPAGSVVVCEVPLLFEAGMEGLFDLIVTIEAGGDDRRKRSTHDFDLELFGEFDSLQASSERRVAGSDFVFLNDGDVERLRAFVRETYERARASASEER